MAGCAHLKRVQRAILSKRSPQTCILRRRLQHHESSWQGRHRQKITRAWRPFVRCSGCLHEESAWQIHQMNPFAAFAITSRFEQPYRVARGLCGVCERNVRVWPVQQLALSSDKFPKRSHPSFMFMEQASELGAKAAHGGRCSLARKQIHPYHFL